MRLKDRGRIVGVLLFLQLAGLIVPFVLLLPLTVPPRDYLANAAEASFQIKVAALLLFATCALTIGISIAAFRVFSRYSQAAALWLLAVGVIMFIQQAVDNVHLLSMLSLSQHYGQTGGPDQLFLSLATVVGSTRRWAHITELLVIDCWILSFYSALYRFALVPRLVAIFGLITVLLHFAGIPARSFAGYSAIGAMGVPMALSHITLSLWLVAKGFDDRLRPDPHSVPE
jgi:hypothetical protein